MRYPLSARSFANFRLSGRAKLFAVRRMTANGLGMTARAGFFSSVSRFLRNTRNEAAFGSRASAWDKVRELNDQRKEKIRWLT